jgi:hypothetical protein
LIEELRGQKAKLQKKPEKGLESLMEYFGEIAAGPTVGKSGKAGAQAAERLRLRELEKEKQANALSERMIEAAQKQQDAIYGCWVVSNDRIHVRYRNGTVKIYDKEGWVYKNDNK